jgi:GNAT superfamily N-acetyltransferase
MTTSRSEVVIRRAGSTDTDQAADLYLSARQRAAELGTIPPLVHDAEDVTRWIGGRISDAECWLAEASSGAVVGLLVLDGDLLDQLYVDPDLTGNGIGGELVALAKRERPEGLRLWTFVSNEGAQRFYARHGFVEVRRTDGSDNEERAPDILYVWRPSVPPG